MQPDRTLFVIVLALLLVGAARQAGDEDPSFVFEGKHLLKITGEEFLNLTRSDASRDGYLVFFGADWCGHCTKFKPVFLNLSTIVSERETGPKPAFLFYLVDKEEHATKLFRLTGYPSLLYIKDSRFWKFTGRRTEDEIVQWIDSIETFESKPYPDRVFSFWEEIQDSLDHTKSYFVRGYKNTPLKFISVGIVALIFLLLFCVCFCQIISEDPNETDSRLKKDK